MHRLPIDLGHGVCGPWGCGPPTLTLVSCHLAWLTVLAPPTWWALVRWPSWSVPLSTVMFLGSLLTVAGLAWYVHFRWLPSVGEFYQPYGWQRLGFVLATEVQYPVVETGVIGAIALIIQGLRRRSSSELSSKKTEEESTTATIAGSI